MLEGTAHCDTEVMIGGVHFAPTALQGIHLASSSDQSRHDNCMSVAQNETIEGG